MASKSQRNRTYLLCPFCKETHFSLPTHLKKACMKRSRCAEIQRVVDAAKRESSELLRQGRVWKYSIIRQILDSPDPVSSLIKELENRGNVVHNIPPEQKAPSTVDKFLLSCPAASKRESGSKTNSKTVPGGASETVPGGASETVPGGASDKALENSGELEQRVDDLDEEVVPLSQCLAVLDAARDDFLVVVRKLGDPLNECLPTRSELQLFLYYLEAVVILGHLQWPWVIELMTISEWKQRKISHGGHVVVAVKQHKFSEREVAAFALSQEEETWFNLYFTDARPKMQGRKRKHPEDEADESEEKFFISFSGNGIYSASNDLAHLHRKYQLPMVTSQMARRAFEAASEKMTNTEKLILVDYLSLTAARVTEDVVVASLLFRRLVSESGSEERGASPSAGGGGSCMVEDDVYDSLIQSCPVTLEIAAPKRSDLLSLPESHRQRCVDKHCGPHRPSESKVNSWIQKQGCTAHVPDAAVILQQCKPSEGVDTSMGSGILQKFIRTQKWTGLVVADTKGKGRGVFTTRPFACGEVVCDFHGRQVSRQEGLNIHQNSTDTGRISLFFYKDQNEQEKCIDAHEEPCECHPDRTILGKAIQHSSKKPNLRPRLFSLDNKDLILFIALRDIASNEQLFFNYGLRKKAFAGEGLDLDWV